MGSRRVLFLKFLYIIPVRYNENFHKRYIVPLLTAGCQAEVWEAMEIVRPLAATEYRPPFPADACAHRSFKSKEELLTAVKTIEEDVLLVAMLHYEKETHAFYRACLKFRGKVIALHPKTCPLPTDAKQHEFSVGQLLKNLPKKIGSLNKIRKSIALSPSLPAEWTGIRSMDMLVVNSQTPRPSNYPIGPNTKKVLVPSMDYTSFVAWQKAGRPSSGVVTGEKPLLAYIDSSAPNHPDYLRFPPHKRKLTEGGLYPYLRNLLFSFQEAGFKVVVAAHPTATWKGWLEHYDGFEIVQGKTLELISDANLVVNTASTAISYAILLRKPVMTVTTDELEACHKGHIVRYYAQLMGKSVTNISKEYFIDLKEEMRVDEMKYQRFQDEYVLPPGIEGGKTFWEHLLNKIGRLGF
jgi:hypothetical protein